MVEKGFQGGVVDPITVSRVYGIVSLRFFDGFWKIETRTSPLVLLCSAHCALHF